MTMVARLLLPLDKANLAELAKDGVDMRNEYGEPGRGTRNGDRRPRYALVKVTDRNGATEAISTEFDDIVPGASRAEGRTPLWPDTFDALGTRWHSLALTDGKTGRTVRLVLPALTNSNFETGTPMRLARPALVTLPLLAVLVWLSIGRSLLPLTSLVAAIRSRDASRLEPIEMTEVVREVRPLVDSINKLLAKLSATFDRERAFTSQAAHELKTPLAAIKVQAQVALLAENDLDLRKALHGVIEGVDRSAHLAQQMLLLARLDDQTTADVAMINLGELVRAVLAERSAEFKERQLAVSVFAGGASLARADPSLVRIALNNLLDNALKYVQPAGKVELRILENADATFLEVVDDGPGVLPEEQERLVDRFFRGANAKASGTGLGLSIVARIASFLDATLAFSDGLDRRGLSVRMTFPKLDGHANSRIFDSPVQKTDASHSATARRQLRDLPLRH
ncbi:ATP-binding protein [Caballeronia grimmiae]|uniref:ATP-binding protein n=1 Tax=Caballeronia grimmiae TaxID=1071679 RepID=UPI0038B70875